MEIEFKDRVVIVTGSGQGIGREIAKAFASNGASVVLSDYNSELLNEVKSEFLSNNYKFLAVPCDVTIAEEVENLLEETIGEFSKIDILVNNAGIARDTLLIRMKDEQWDSVINTNLKGVFLMTRAVTKHFLKQRHGKIINISSVVGITGNAGQSNYSASKAGVIGFSKSVARELASRNITVNVIAPGYIDTPMTLSLPESVKEDYMKRIPLNRVGSPIDVANVALFLASQLADYITGQVINVDGGMVM